MRLLIMGNYSASTQNYYQKQSLFFNVEDTFKKIENTLGGFNDFNQK